MTQTWYQTVPGNSKPKHVFVWDVFDAIFHKHVKLRSPSHDIIKKAIFNPLPLTLYELC